MNVKRLKKAAAGMLVAGTMLLFSFEKDRPAEKNAVRNVYTMRLQQLYNAADSFKVHAATMNDSLARIYFADCRDAYKHVECIVEYYYPLAAKRMNGAAVAETEPGNPDETVLPAGLQVLETYVYAADMDLQRKNIIRELDLFLFIIKQLQQQSATPDLAPTAVYDAIRLNLYCLASKGISGFESPLALRSIHEAAVTIHAAEELLQATGTVSPALEDILHRTGKMLEANEADFNGFDRARFFVRYYNPLLHQLYIQQQHQHIPFIKARRAVRTGAESFLSANAFDPYFFAPDGNTVASPELLALGAKLFSEKMLAQGNRSCATCHIPGKAYADGLPVNSSLHGEDMLKRNTPTLLNTALQPALFYDTRVRYLEEQVRAVIGNKAEMAGDLDAAVVALKKDTRYNIAFAKAFSKETTPVSEENICKAIAAYIRSLVRLNSRFDRYMRGDTIALSQPEIKGFNLFMGKAQCGTCHYMPLFNGAVPASYDKAEGEVLGVPATADTLHAILDADPGMYAYFHVPVKQYAFKTPTVRNAALTAPYMHNGVFRTLEEVIDFYDRGGGNGLGLNVRSQTLSSEKLHLTGEEKQDIIAFIRSLNDE